MSHGIDVVNGKATMAYATATKTPWHGLGNIVDPNAPISDWQTAAGLAYQVIKGELLFRDAAGTVHDAGRAFNRSVLYRDDTLAPLSVMSVSSYKVHQPSEILAFVKDVSDAMGWPVNTAGALFNGKKIWALLQLPEAFELPGGDKVTGHLLASTSFDGTTGSEFRFVSERVVCNNTLQMALGEKGKGVTVYHDRNIDQAQIKADLGVYDSVWCSFIEKAKRLAGTTVTREQAVQILRKVYGEEPDTTDHLTESAARVINLFDGAGIGSRMESAAFTGWGLVNAVTQDLDHFGSNRNSKLNSAWFGPGAARKQAVVDAILA